MENPARWFYMSHQLLRFGWLQHSAVVAMLTKRMRTSPLLSYGNDPVQTFYQCLVAPSFPIRTIHAAARMKSLVVLTPRTGPVWCAVPERHSAWSHLYVYVSTVCKSIVASLRNQFSEWKSLFSKPLRKLVFLWFLQRNGHAQTWSPKRQKTTMCCSQKLSTLLDTIVHFLQGLYYSNNKWFVRQRYRYLYAHKNIRVTQCIHPAFVLWEKL